MGRLYNTEYKKPNGTVNPARIEILSQTPSDTLVTVDPKGGTSHRINLSGNDSSVERFTGQDGWIPESDFFDDHTDYWVNVARQAYNNKTSFGDRVKKQWSPYINTAKDAVKKGVSSAKETVKEGVNDAKEFAQEAWGSFKSKIGFKQQGGQLSQEQQELQFALIGYVVATKQQPKNEQEINQIAQQLIQLKQQDPEKYNQLVQIGQQAQAQKAEKGAKLNYLKSLKGRCPEGEELVYFKKGGMIDCGCQKKAKGGEVEEQPMNAVQEFKKKRK